jgi:hypothetical protein
MSFLLAQLTVVLPLHGGGRLSICLGACNAKNVQDVGVKEQYHVKISDRFACLENLANNVGINSTCENIR